MPNIQKYYPPSFNSFERILLQRWCISFRLIHFGLSPKNEGKFARMWVNLDFVFI